ncbi:Fanconi anemia group I protein-like isoform X2 [Dendronephthya gigantea]|uniref:Fanconi anemia group I protein-like isoform X2 n=1 Tax=Dendronephthya gigantea TaxID=151771 RepID=UPI00106DA457|nr:Fanconi anemia group I protein-like isoform X2 [Dendronephthya gigantea]
MASKLEKTVISLAKKENKDELVRTLNEIKLEKLGIVLTSRVNENNGDVAEFLRAVFQGSPSESEKGSERQKFLFNHCMDILKEADVSSKLATDFVGVLLFEIDKISSQLLCELGDKIVESVRKGSLKNGRVLQLFPKILSSMASRESIPLPTDHGGGELKGIEYKSQMINTLCSTKWHSSCVIHLVNMFREVTLTNEELKFVIEKILRMFKSLELEEVPPVVYQLLILCTKGHRISVLEGVIDYFTCLDVECAQNEGTARDEELQGISSDQLRHTEGNVILHITFAMKQDQELGKEFVKHLKASQQHPQKILVAFNLAIALSVAQIHRFEEPIFDVLKAAVLKCFKSIRLRNASKWMQDNVENIPDISKEILQTVQNSMFGWDHVAQGIVQLGFLLMDAFGSKNHDASNMAQCTPQQESCQLGNQILLKTFKVHDKIRTEILEQIFNRLLTKATSTSNHYIDLLQKAVVSNPQALLDSISKVKEAFEYLSCLPFITARGLLQAVLPLMKISITLRDSLMLVLRKAMFSRNLEARKIAVSGFLLVLKHFKVRASNITSSQSLSQSSQSSAHSSSQIQVDVHNTSSGGNTGNEALCLEILGGLRRCFNQQADVRILLYEGLCDVLNLNSELQQSAMEIVHKQFLKYYEHDEEILPPLKLDPCLTAAGDQVFLAEPLGHLLSLLQQSLVRNLNSSEQDDPMDTDETEDLNRFTEKLKEEFTSLTQRMNKSELDDFELDKSADYSLGNGVGVKNNIFACLVLGVFEVLMEHAFTVGDFSEESCEMILSLFNKYWKLSNLLKGTNASQGKKAKQSSSKQIARSLFSLSAIANILKAVLSDALPGHQASLDTLRNSGDFVQYILTVTLQKLTQINDNGYCDGANGKNAEHVYRQCTKIARVLLKTINGESSITKNLDKIVSHSLHSMFLVINIIGNRYREKIQKFLAALDRDNQELEAVDDENELIHRHITKYQVLIVTTLASPSDTMSMKDLPHMINIISLLTRCLKPALDKISQVQSWVKRICMENNIDDVNVSKSFVSFMLSLTTQSSSKLTLEKELAADIHKNVGDIDEDIEMTDDSYFAIVNERTAAPSLLMVLLSQTDKVLDEIDWFLAKIKADNTKTSLQNEEEDDASPSSPRSGQEKSVCDRITSIVHAFHELVQSAIPVGTCTELLLKTLTKFYSTLGVIAKYYLSLYAQKRGHVTPSFEKMVKCSGTQLSQQVYAFLTYVQTAEQETRGKAKDKVSTRAGNLTKVRVMKEMKSVPNLIYAVEQYERYLIQLTKKSKVNFMEHFKRSTSRDFRINGATLDAALREDSSEDEEEPDTAKENEEPPKKKGKK